MPRRKRFTAEQIIEKLGVMLDGQALTVWPGETSVFPPGAQHRW